MRGHGLPKGEAEGGLGARGGPPRANHERLRPSSSPTASKVRLVPFVSGLPSLDGTCRASLLTNQLSPLASELIGSRRDAAKICSTSVILLETGAAVQCNARAQVLDLRRSSRPFGSLPSSVAPSSPLSPAQPSSARRSGESANRWACACFCTAAHAGTARGRRQFPVAFDRYPGCEGAQAATLPFPALPFPLPLLS